MLWRSLRNRLAALPSRCLVCHAWPSLNVCETCVARFAQPVPRCRTCALPLPAGLDRCGACIKDPPPLARCLAAVSYDYPWSSLIASYKFNSFTGLTPMFAELLRSTPWVEPALEQADLVLAMALSTERLRERGYNQSLLLARALAPTKVDADTLLRIRHGLPQRELPRHERLKNVQGAFALEPSHAHRVKGKHLVLVDDVMTSGASLHAAAQTLLTAGAQAVTAVVIARTV